MRVTIWHEYRHEKHHNQKVADIYPDGMHRRAGGGFGSLMTSRFSTATLDEPEHGLTQEVLDNTDVLTWWGHMAHEEV